MKGYHIPFHLHDKYTRIPEDDIANRYKIKLKKIPFQDVRRAVQEIKEKREREEQKRLMEQNEKYLKKMRFIQKTHDRLRQEKLKKIVEERNSMSVS